MDMMVRSGLVTAWRLATWPTRRSPSLVKATTDGVVRLPSELAMTTGSPPSRTATTELVVPRSMPTTLANVVASFAVGKLPVASLRHPHEAGADQLRSEEIPALELLNHRIRLVSRRRDPLDGLMVPGIESLSHRLHRLEACLLQHRAKLVVYHADAGHKTL